ncbi:Sugar transporter ERD6-like 16 [Zostera marina]|uniref:Sugar transporter ERD6-like 16 n=1 Tax=Zostera marina TaxID=29655 RepID=A0A0K9NJE4_ZOSMR|nr:Sugar transporter ERD6-like 16 [Zostera marina]
MVKEQRDVERGTTDDGKYRERDTEPLIEKDVVGGNTEGSISISLLSTAVAVLGSFQYGLCIGYSSPTQSGIINELNLSLSEFSLFGSFLTVGAMIGAITCGKLTDYLGRKRAMGFSSVFCLFGWFAIYFAGSSIWLDLGRLFGGVGIGVFSYVVPVFVAEISPANLRGTLTAINQVMICGGVASVYIIGLFVTWRRLTILGIVPCLILLLGLFFIPDSPRWLAKVGNTDMCKSSLQRLRGRDADISNELAEIQEYIQTVNTLPRSRLRDLFQRRYSRTLIVGVGLMLLQQFGGVNAVNFYASETFISAGFSSGSLGTISLGVIQVLFTIIGSLLMDKSGRRSLLMISASGSCLGTFLAGLSFFFTGQGIFLDWASMLALVGIVVYIGSFAIGIGGIPWVIMSEIFPINIKGIGGSMVTLSNWAASWIVTFGFNFLMDWSCSGTFFIFSAVSGFTILFIFKMVPETKGRTLEEIQTELNS